MTQETTNHEAALQARIIETVRAAVCAKYGFSEREIRSMRKTGPLAKARQVGMALARDLSNASYNDIARAFGKKDHGTAAYASAETILRLNSDGRFAIEYESIQATVCKNLNQNEPTTA
jgi:chromosomal replication initiator protein